MTLNPITEFEFRAWLGSLPPETVVSQDWDCSSCPIAMFLRANGAEGATVHPRSYWPGSGEYLDLPPWALEFVTRVDRIKGRLLTAEEAIWIVDRQYLPKERLQ